jgi:hypothetical protein
VRCWLSSTGPFPSPGVKNNIWCANVVIPTKFKIGGKRLNSPTRPQKLSTYPHAKEQVEKTAKLKSGQTVGNRIGEWKGGDDVNPKLEQTIETTAHTNQPHSHTLILVGPSPLPGTFVPHSHLFYTGLSLFSPK